MCICLKVKYCSSKPLNCCGKNVKVKILFFSPINCIIRDKQYSVWGYIFTYKLMYSKMCENCNNGVT